jgi:hypothetical protein
MINKKTDSDVNAVPRVGYQDFWKSLWPDPEPSAADTKTSQPKALIHRLILLLILRVKMLVIFSILVV